MQLTPGQNAALPATVLRFSATSATAFDLSALVADDSQKALSSDDFVFYNQPHTRGIRLGPDGVEIDLAAIRPDAGTVLCIASVDPGSGATGVFETVGATLHDQGGGVVAALDITCRSGESAVICWEFYRRAGRWKVRAVGQGYSDGLAGLITRHGVDVDDDTSEPPAGRPPAAAPSTSYAPIEPLDPNRILERFEMILEDGARSAGAYLTAVRFAESRLDDELSAAVADPATRNGPEAEAARARAQHRHDTVVTEARARYDQDSAHLAAELAIIGPDLPRPFAEWTSPVWSSPDTAVGRGDGFRIGELSASADGPLRIPLCLPLPLPQPLRIIGPDTADTAAVVFATMLRVLTSDREIRLDVVDLSGGLRAMTSVLAQGDHGTAVTAVDGVTDYFDSLSAHLELALLDRADGFREPSAPRRLLVLNHFPFGYEQRHWPAIAFLAEHGPALGVSLVIVGEWSSSGESNEDAFAGRSYPLPASLESQWRDPWAHEEWTFTPDRVPADSTRLADLLAHLEARRSGQR